MRTPDDADGGVSPGCPQERPVMEAHAALPREVQARILEWQRITVSDAGDIAWQHRTSSTPETGPSPCIAREETRENSEKLNLEQSVRSNLPWTFDRNTACGPAPSG